MKNVLDLEYSTYSQYINTLVVVFFSYIIALLFAVLSGQISLFKLQHMAIILSVTLFVLIGCTLVLLFLAIRMKEIRRRIRELSFHL